ncbi:MAG: TyeA family type III secretion system gatekeeper subunit [Deltaproteobacteria bacterium]|jgi:type III secretion protein W|nr:TyeA family type III secretion system gatekeeper subunit [Deltaproteobacteria bacterium]
MGIESAQFTPGGVGAGLGQGLQMEGLSRGIFMGSEVVKADNPMSLLADAAEELTFSLSESQEFKLDERKEKVGSSRSLDFIEAARRVLQQLDEKAGRALNHLERLCKTKNNMELADLMSALGEALEREGAGRDAADEFTLLLGLKERLGGGHPLAGTLDSALEALADKEPAAIASGLAVDFSARDFADLGEGRELRGVYRGVVADFTSPRDVLTRLLKQFGTDHLDKGLDFLMTTLGHEMSSAAPSAEKAQLKALTGDLSAVRVLGIVHARCSFLLDRLEQAHGVKSPLAPGKLLDGVLALRDSKYVGSQDFERLVYLAAVPDTERKVLFLQDMLQELRDLPDLFYDGHETRLRVQDAAQTALDEAVRREEEELGF